ncbi:MAG: hypothetical protein ABI891_00240 [Acidobacteriota bacterium]
MFGLPAWAFRPLASTWTFTTSESGEFDALIFAAGKGSFYVTDSRDPDEIVHEILYVGAGVTKSKGPIPFGVGGAFSTPDMPSSGVGPIMMGSSKSSLELSDFEGSGIIFSAAAGIGKGKDYAIILFGLPPFTVAGGRMEGIQYMAPGFGFTAMPCYFTVDP